jgi:hypothetical protein
MGPPWRLSQLTRGLRWRLVRAALLGLGSSVAGIGRLALAGYGLALVLPGHPFAAVFVPLAGVAVCLVLRAIRASAKEAVGNRTAWVSKPTVGLQESLADVEALREPRPGGPKRRRQVDPHLVAVAARSRSSTGLHPVGRPTYMGSSRPSPWTTTGCAERG